MKGIIAILSLLPLRALYGLTDTVLYPLMYYAVRYRRNVVNKNLRLSFPEKSEQERKIIEKKFYHHLCDVIAEIIWSYRATDEEMRQHIVFENLSAVEQWAQEKGGVFYMLGHFGNWEWTADVQKRYVSPDIRHYNVYRRLKNASSDRAMTALRDKRSGEGSCIEKNTLLRRLVKLRQEQAKFTLGLISDQKPSPKNAHYWTEFLHQDTSFLDGGEVLARKFDYVVTYVHITCVQRGYYRACIELITDNAPQEPENAITQAFAEHLEANIQEQPEMWLWSHNRWKWKRDAH